MSTLVSSFGATHVGYKRKRNEDSFICAPEDGFWLIADGLGGHAAGDVASAIVADQVARAHRASIPIAKAFLIANQFVIDAPKKGHGTKGMGSTAIALILNKNTYEITWTGDSRAYLWTGTSLARISKDHTLVQRLVDRGAITEEEAFSHPLKNVLDQAIGLGVYQLVVDQVTNEMLAGERLLLCSDGLSGEVPHPEMESIFLAGLDDQVTIERLIRSALEHGGHDNVTVIVVSMRDDARK